MNLSSRAQELVRGSEPEPKSKDPYPLNPTERL